MSKTKLSWSKALLVVTAIFLSEFLFAQVFAIELEDASYINAATYFPENDAALFFSGSSILIHDITATEIEKGKWFELDGLNSVDAALNWSETEVFLFSGSYYQILNLNSVTVSSDSTLWQGLPKTWNDSLDACVRWSEDEVYFFKGDEYIIYDFLEESYTIYDRMSAWEGYPENWTSPLEAVCNINGEIYFINEGQALKYSTEDKAFYGPGPLTTTNER